MIVANTVNTTTTYRAHAKLNLYLEVMDRRADGYHDIETIFQTIGLSDELRFTATQDALIAFHCSCDELSGEDNLALRAARLLHQRFAPDSGVRIELDKHIPVAAGLAGGSADAAATLIALNDLWSLELDTATLQVLALELGSDIPYLTVGGTVAATGRGERLMPLAPLRDSWFVLIHPPMEVSTARVYNHPGLARSVEERPDGTSDSFQRALALLGKGAIADVFYNALETPVFFEYPQLAVAKQRLIDRGCASALMSGSGPTLYGLCRNEDHATTIAAQFEDMETFVVPSVPSAVERID